MVEKKSLELKKHVATIHSSNKLSLLQRKIANALLYNAYEELFDRDEHEIHIAVLCQLIGYDSHDYKSIRKALINLLATVVEWNLVDGDKLDTGGIWNASSIIADASIEGPICTYSYSNKMKKLLHKPELYGRLNMLVQAKFQSSYGLALYENCIRFQSIEQTPCFDLATFRKLMGVADGKYLIFRDFKHRVLDKAVEEVNKHSPIFITPELYKTNRQVTGIQFHIRPSPKNNAEVIIDSTRHLSERLLSFNLSKKQIDTILTQYSEDYILAKIRLVESSTSYRQGKITNLAKYLLCALQEDYQPAKPSPPAITVSSFDESEEKYRQKQLEQHRMEQYRRYQNQEILQIFEQKTVAEQAAILIEFEKYLGKDSMYYMIFLRDKLENILVQDQLCLFVRYKKAEWLNRIISYQDFCQQNEKSFAG